MKLETPFIALIISSLFFLGIFGVFTQIAATYEEAGMIDTSSGLDFRINNNTQQFNEAFNQINQTKTEINLIAQQFDDIDVSFTSIWPAIEIIFSTGKLIINSVGTVNTVGKATGQVIGIDPTITNGLFIVLLIIIILAVLLILAGRTQ